MINNTKNNHAVENDIAIDTIITMIQPEAIYRLPATTNDGNMQLIVIIPDTAQTLFKHYEAILELVGIQHNDGFQYWLHSTAQLHQLIINKTPFYLQNCIEAYRIYDNGSHKLPAIINKPKATVTENALAGFTAAYAKALTFMEGAQLFKRREQKDMAAFMLHQCIELSLHATILAFTGKDINTHSITVLLQHVQQHTDVFNHIFHTQTGRKNDIAEILERIYKESGASPDPAIANQWLTLLFEKATEMLAIIEEKGKRL